MKLIICTNCQDVVRLQLDEERTCKCGLSGGKYINELDAEYWGECFPLGCDNRSLAYAITNQPIAGLGKDFKAFVIPKICKTFKKIIKGEVPK